MPFSQSPFEINRPTTAIAAIATFCVALSRCPDIPITGLVKRAAMADDRPAQLYLSYRDADTGPQMSDGTAGKIRKALMAAGYTVFSYTEDIIAGDAFGK